MVTPLEPIWAPRSPKEGKKCQRAWDVCFAASLGRLPRFPAGVGGTPYQQFLEALWVG